MLKNDETFWSPRETVASAASLSWGGSGGDFHRLRDHSRERWDRILACLARVGAPAPSGRIVEFGSGMGLLDELIDAGGARILMLDHTDAYVRHRPGALSSRCRHVRWSASALDALRPEHGSYDWLLAIAVFYHVDDATAAALIRELGALLKPAGFALIAGWNTATVESVREMATRERLFSRYPRYALNLDLLREALAPEYDELCREGILLYRKRQAG